MDGMDRMDGRREKQNGTTVPPYPVLSVQQPWAWALVAGPKPVENRKWATGYRGPLWIHASQGKRCLQGLQAAGEVFPDGSRWPEEELVFGAVLGLVELTDCFWKCGGPLAWHRCCWACGPVLWRVRNPRRLRRPIRAAGALGLWYLPADVEAAALMDLEG